MSYCIEKDMGEGKPPAFFGGMTGSGPTQTPTWTTLEHAAVYPTEATANRVIDAYYDLIGECIVMPYDEEVKIK